MASQKPAISLAMVDFPEPEGPHNGGDLPGAGGKAHIVEDLLLPIIGEAHPVKTEGTLSQLHRLSGRRCSGVARKS